MQEVRLGTPWSMPSEKEGCLEQLGQKLEAHSFLPHERSLILEYAETNFHQWPSGSAVWLPLEVVISKPSDGNPEVAFPFGAAIYATREGIGGTTICAIRHFHVRDHLRMTGLARAGTEALLRELVRNYGPRVNMTLEIGQTPNVRLGFSSTPRVRWEQLFREVLAEIKAG